MNECLIHEADFTAAAAQSHWTTLLYSPVIAEGGEGETRERGEEMSDMERGPGGVEDVTQHQRQGIPHKQEYNTSYLESTDKQKRTDRNAAASYQLTWSSGVSSTPEMYWIKASNIFCLLVPAQSPLAIAGPRARFAGYYAHS